MGEGVTRALFVGLVFLLAIGVVAPVWAQDKAARGPTVAPNVAAPAPAPAATAEFKK